MAVAVAVAVSLRGCEVGGGRVARLVAVAVAVLLAVTVERASAVAVVVCYSWFYDFSIYRSSRT